MSIRCDDYNGVRVVVVGRDLAGDAVAEAQRLVDESLARRGGHGLVFDLGDCGFVDSAGLELLCRTRRRCEGAGARVTLARAGGACAKILDVTRLTARFDCHADLTRAVAAAR